MNGLLQALPVLPKRTLNLDELIKMARSIEQMPRLKESIPIDEELRKLTLPQPFPIHPQRPRIEGIPIEDTRMPQERIPISDIGGFKERIDIDEILNKLTRQPYKKSIEELFPQLPQEKWHKEQLMGYLKGKLSKGEYGRLPQMGDIVTKMELLRGIKPKPEEQVEEVVKENKIPPENKYLPEKRTIAIKAIQEEGSLGFDSPTQALNNLERSEDLDRYDITPKNKEIIKDYLDFRNYTAKPVQETKFSQYQLPGGENYREMLIKAPLTKTPEEIRQLGLLNKNKLAEADRIRTRIIEIEHKYPIQVYEQMSEWKKLDKQWNDLHQEAYKAEKSQVDFKSSHWDEPNVLAHLRLNDRTTPEGKKVLFIEELQSDWAKEARKAPIERSTSAEMPQHPLLKNWQELALKRAIKEAVEGDYDYISWTTGEQQAERYDLSKQVEDLTVAKTPESFYKKGIPVTGGKYRITGYKNANVVIERYVDDINDIDQYIGKEIGKKIRDGFTQGKDQVMLHGQDLKIGGEWAKNLYDRQVPNMLKNLTKGEVTQVILDKPTDYYLSEMTQPALKITPEIKAKILGTSIKQPKLINKKTMGLQ